VQDTPGPGSYHAEPVAKKSPAFTMRKRINLKQPDTPGPGAYEDEFDVLIDTAPAFTLGTRREQPTRRTPGPGSYATPTTPKGVSSSFAQRLPEKIKDGPGPGAHSPEHPQRVGTGPKKSISLPRFDPTYFF
jgi:hypothetical protein